MMNRHSDYRAFFKRTHGLVDGVFSLIRYDYIGDEIVNQEKILDRVPARSGQRRAAGRENVIGASPIPYGDFWIHADKDNQRRQKPGRSGIGWFFHISSNKDNPATIAVKRAWGLVTRTYIGIHGENSFYGSAGCIVLVDWRHMAKLGELFLRIKDVHSKIPLKVFQ